MKNNLKINKFLLALFFVVFFSCEKDLFEQQIYESQTKVSSKILVGQKAKNAALRLTKILGKKYNISENSNSRVAMSSIGEISYNEVMQVTDTTGKSTYTFRLEHPETSNSKFFNLVIEEKSQGNVVKLMEYTMTPEFALEFNQTKSYANFRGTLDSQTIINETPCPDEDLIDVQIGVVGGGSGGGVSSGSGGGSGASPGGGSDSGSSGTGSSSGSGGTGTGSGSTGSGSGSSGGSSGGSVGGSGGGGILSLEEAYLLMYIECISSCVNCDFTDDGDCLANPRYFRISIDPIDSEPCNPVISVGILTPYTNCEKLFMLSLSTEEKNWLYNQQVQGTDDYAQLVNYLNGENSDCSEERNNIAKELIKQLKRGSKVDFENKIIIDSSFVTNQKAMCVYTKMKQINAFNKALEPFDGDNPVAFLKFSTNDLYNKRAATVEPDSNNIIEIIVNNDSTVYGIDYQPNVLLCQTIIHEVIHAEFFRQIIVALNNGSYTENIDEIIIALNNSEYKKLAAYMENKLNWAHEYMATEFRRTIGRITEQYATGIEVAGVPQVLFTQLAWRGLNYDDIPAWFNQPDNLKANILTTISNYTLQNSNQTCQ